MEVEDEAEIRKKLDEQCRRSHDRLSFVSKEMQESVKESLQHQLQEVEKRRHDLVPEHQKAQKKSQKIQSFQDKRRNMQKDSTAAEEEVRGSSKRSGKRRSVTFSYQTRSISIRCRMQKWWQSFRVCRREKKEEAAMRRRHVIAPWRPYGSNSSPWEQMEPRGLYTKASKANGSSTRADAKKRRRTKANARRDQSRCTGEFFGA